MVAAAVLSTATLAGFALLIVLSIVLYRYYHKNKSNLAMMSYDSKHSSLRDSKRSTSSFKSDSSVTSIQLPHQEISISKEEPQRAPSHRFKPRNLKNQTRHLTESLHHVRLSLPEVIVPPSFFGSGNTESSTNASTTTPSQSSYSLPTLKQRSKSRTGSDDIGGSTSSADSPPPMQPPPPLSASPRNRLVSMTSTTTTTPPSASSNPPEFQFPQPDGAVARAKLSTSPLLPATQPCSSEAVSPIGALQLDLYQNKDILFIYAKGKDENRRCGRLHFRLSYDFDKSDFIVHVIEAHNLSPPEGNKFNDPFVIVRLEPEIDNKNRQTEIRRNSTDPLFDEIFKFPIAYDDMKNSDLIMELFDYDRFSRNEIIGEVNVDLEEIDVTSGLEVWSDIIKSNKTIRDPQEILVSLSYLPSAERLTVVVLKAKNLPIPDSVRDPDLYVKVILMSGEGKMKKKKTSSRKGTPNPVWNEALTFSVSQDNFGQCQLIVTVINQDRLGNGHSIGSCVFGINRKNREYLHWRDVMKNPRKSFAMWHQVSTVWDIQNRL